MTDDLRFDPARKAAIRSMLHETVQQSARKEPARRKRIVLFASVTAAALVLVGGIGYAATTMGSSGPDRGFAGVDPSQTSAPVPSPSDEPGSTTVPSKDPGNVQGAGTASPTPVVAENDPADPSTWIIGFNSVGPLTLDRPVSEQASAQSAYTGKSLDDPETGYRCSAWRLASPDYITMDLLPSSNDASTTSVISIGGSSGDRADLPGPHTAKGIGVGSTVAELKAAYPDLVVSWSDTNVSSLEFSVTDGNGRYIAFKANDDNSTVRYIESNTTGRIGVEIC